MEMTMIEKLPDGVHRLSDESIADIKRIAEFNTENTARFAKRGS
jgi:hypothetical protein